ncbi:MAG: hypothetical protein HDT41_02990 [Lachnospiraceae bacterium]|nr:hypothetical protein [Lachnospiraceae bacterium]
MDNFMDKLTKRFSAGEMIKANGAAEERELQRAREQASENEKLLQEIRRLNLKNVELTEQAGQLIQCGIEQFEEYDRTADKAKGSFEEYVKEVRELLVKIEAGMEKVSAEIAEMKNISQTMAEVPDEAADDTKEQLLQAIKALEEHVHKENVKVYRNVQAVVMDQSTQRAREMGDRLDALERNAKKNKSLLPLTVLTFLAAAAALVLQLMGMF